MQASLVLSACVVVVLGSSPVRAENNTLRVLSKVFDRCGQDPDMYSCLKVRAVTLLERALALDSLPVTEYLSIARDPAAGDSAPMFRSRGDLEASLPRDLDARGSTLDRILVDRLSRYLQTRTLRLNVPKEVFQGRDKGPLKGYKGGKGDKGGGVFLVFGAFAAMLLQLALGKVALIAGKALLVGKVALLLAGIIGLKSLLSHGQGESHSPQVIYAEPENHGSWGRSLGDHGAQNLAYRGHKPTPSI